MFCLTWLHPRRSTVGCFSYTHSCVGLYGLSYCLIPFQISDTPAKLCWKITPTPQAGFTPAFNISRMSQDDETYDVNVAHIHLIKLLSRSSSSATALVAIGRACFHASGGSKLHCFFRICETRKVKPADSIYIKHICQPKI